MISISTPRTKQKLLTDIPGSSKMESERLIISFYYSVMAPKRNTSWKQEIKKSFFFFFFNRRTFIFWFEMEKAYFAKYAMSWAVLYMNAGVEREGPEFEWERKTDYLSSVLGKQRPFFSRK